MKRLKQFAVAASLVALSCAPGFGQSKQPTPTEQANLKLALDWWREGFVARHAEVVDKYLDKNMIQHNPNMADGNERVKGLLSGMKPVNPIPATIPADRMPALSFAKGDYAALIWERDATDPSDATKKYKYNDFDLFRIANGKIVEHWDGAMKNAQEGSGAANTNADTKPHGGSTGTLSAQEKKNQDIADGEMRDILQYGHLELADKVMAPGYIQHNPNVPGGRDGFKTFFARFAKPTELKPEWKRPPVLVLTSGNIVFYLVENEGKDPADPAKTYKYNWFDMLRVDDGMIQEHWDTAKKNPPPPPGKKQ